jgi:hypothetical protein
VKRSGISRKPGKGLARGDGLKRTGALGANPEKVREWLQRSAGKAHTNRRRATPRDAVRAARVRSQGCCVQCGAPETNPRRWPHHPHHVFPVRAAFDSFPELEGEPANIILLCPGCHDNHERAHRRVPLAKLPPETVALAVGHPDRQRYLERTYQ